MHIYQTSQIVCVLQKTSSKIKNNQHSKHSNPYNQLRKDKQHTIEIMNSIISVLNRPSPLTPTQRMLHQLKLQQKSPTHQPVDEDRIDDIYQILTKVQSKNLMLIQLLVFLIEKGFVRNQIKLHYFMRLYDDIKPSTVHEESQRNASGQIGSSNTNSKPSQNGVNQNINANASMVSNSHNNKPKPEQDQKFSRRKFIQVFKTLSKRLYPSNPLGFETQIYPLITSLQHSDQTRIKLDENTKKLITRETISLFQAYQRELEIVYQIYLPENFNSKMFFTWQEIKYLEKKLPIIAVFRFLWDCQICPNYVTPLHFFEVVSKLIPPHSILVGSGQKEGLFYTAENITNYAKEAVMQKKMKLLEGDIGVSYLELQILLLRLSVDISKQKNDPAKALQNFINLIKLGEVIANKGQVKGKPNRFQDNIKNYFDQNKKVNKNNLQVQKRQTKKKIQEILEVSQSVDQDSKNQFKDAIVSASDLLAIKKGLDDDHLPEIPQPPKIDKQNDKTYNIETKHVVIGQQLPKLPQKNKSVAPAKKPDKKDELLTKFKPENHVTPILSSDQFKNLIAPPKKPRINTQFPIILTEPIYPSDIPNLYINPKSQIYLETAYIHLGERSYEKAFINFNKARILSENSKNQITQFYFLVLEAQIYEAAGRDGLALLYYHKAKELTQNILNKDVIPTLRYLAYKGLAVCLYHMQEYQYSLRCFLKSKQLKPWLSAFTGNSTLPPIVSPSASQILPQNCQASTSEQLPSLELATLENNIACIYMLLNRNTEAMALFAVSAKIMDLRIGKFDQRSIVVQRNQAKNKKAYIQMMPMYKTMWKSYVEKPGIKPPVKGNKKK